VTSTEKILERRVLKLERMVKILERDLQAARGIGVSRANMRSPLWMAGFRVQDLAQSAQAGDALTHKQGGGDGEGGGGGGSGGGGSINEEVFILGRFL